MTTLFDQKTHCNACYTLAAEVVVQAKVVVHWHYKRNNKWLVDQKFCCKCARLQYNKWKHKYWVEINRIGQETRITMKQ